MNNILDKTFVAEAAIGPNLIVKFGATDDNVLQAAAATDKLIGVCGPVAPAIGERVDISVIGIADVKLGGAVTRGDPITANAAGQGVVPAPAVGVNNRVIGYALASGVANDIIPVQLCPGSLQG